MLWRVSWCLPVFIPISILVACFGPKVPGHSPTLQRTVVATQGMPKHTSLEQEVVQKTQKPNKIWHKHMQTIWTLNHFGKIFFTLWDSKWQIGVQFDLRVLLRRRRATVRVVHVGVARLRGLCAPKGRGPSVTAWVNWLPWHNMEGWRLDWNYRHL